MIVRGNCMAAVVASMLELPITEVPNIETLYDVKNVEWNIILYEFIRSRGFEWQTDDRYRIYHFIHEDHYFQEREIIALQNDLYLVSGKSPRGIQHICIYKCGKLVHDPHPTKEGIVTFDFFETIKPIN